MAKSKKNILEVFESGIGVPAVVFIIAIVVVIFYVLLIKASGIFYGILSAFIKISPIWLPILLVYLFWFFWVIYIRSKFIYDQKYTVLEIKLPREIFKSPLAMESVFAGLHQGVGETTWFDKYWLGKIRPWFSFEIASIEGDVRFFIWTRSFWKEVIESQFYAQYPEIEILEVEDYTRMIKFDQAKYGVWGCDFKLSEKDAYPIKTYVDYGLEKDPKEEFKVDPMAPMLEHFGSMGKGEQMWIQFMIRVNKNEKKEEGTYFGKTGWKKEALVEINKLMVRDSKTKTTTSVSASGYPVEPILSKGEQDIIAAIERSITKLGFDVGMRGLYVAEKDYFRPIHILGLVGTVKQFSSNTLNKLEPTRYSTVLKYPWQDYKGKLKNYAGKRVFDAYRRRSYFHHPYKTIPFVMNTEELATVYHLPGSTIQTPTLSRVPSKKAEAPSDLPV